jgi:nitroreductase
MAACGTMVFMELYDVMRSTPAVREFADDPLPDDVLARILDNARFAPTGGNRQGVRVIVLRDRETRSALADLGLPAARRYTAQLANGESPWNPLQPTGVDASAIDATEAPAQMSAPLREAPVVLVICLDLAVVAATDQDLDRVGVVPGASVYPFVWNVLLAARNEGYGGVLTTMAVAEEPRVKELLGVPDPYAIAAVVPLGRPARQVTKLRRRPVSEFTTRERFGGAPFGP